MPHGLQVEPFHQVQHADQTRTLTPGPAGIDGVFAVGPHLRLLHGHREVGEVLHGEQPALRFGEGHHLFRNFALVEEVAGGADSPLAPTADVGPLYLNHLLEHVGQVLLNEGLRGLDGRTGGSENLGVVGPPLQHSGTMGGGAQSGRDGKALVRQPDGWAHHLLKGHGAVPLQRRQPGVTGRGNDASFHTEGQFPVLVNEILGSGRLRPASQSADGDHLVGLRHVDQNRRHSRKAGEVGLGNVNGNPGGNSRVHGVAPFLQHLVSGQGSEVVPRRYYVAQAHGGRSVRVHSIRWHSLPPLHPIG